MPFCSTIKYCLGASNTSVSLIYPKTAHANILGTTCFHCHAMYHFYHSNLSAFATSQIHNSFDSDFSAPSNTITVLWSGFRSRNINLFYSNIKGSLTLSFQSFFITKTSFFKRNYDSSLATRSIKWIALPPPSSTPLTQRLQ